MRQQFVFGKLTVLLLLVFPLTAAFVFAMESKTLSNKLAPPQSPPSVKPKVINVPADFPSIQKAIDSASPGDTVLLAPGKYKENIRLSPGVHLKGSGVKKTKLTRGSKQSTQPIIICAQGCIIENLTIWGSKVGAGGGILVRDCSPTIRNTNIKQNGDAGITIYNPGSRPFITKNAIFNNGYSGINSLRAAPVIFRNRIYLNNNSGLTFMDSEGEIRENKIYNNLEVGIMVGITEEKRNDENFFGVVIQKNIIKKNLTGGISCELASPTILENKIYTKGKMAISLFGSNAVIRKNQLFSSGPPVMRIDEFSSPVVEDNLIKGTLRFAIMNESKQARLKNNKVESKWKPQFNPR